MNRRRGVFFYLTDLTAVISETEEMLENRSSEGFSEASEGLQGYIIPSFSCIYIVLPLVIGNGFIGVIAGQCDNTNSVKVLLFCFLQKVQCGSKGKNMNFNNLLD